MNEKEAWRYFSQEARYYEGGLPPNRKDQYAIRLPSRGIVVAEDTAILWDRFWEKVKTPC